MPQEIQQEVERRLDQIRADSQTLMRYDIDGDGIISPHEWEEVRRFVTTEVTTERARAREPIPQTQDSQTLETLETLQNRYDLRQIIGQGSQGKTYLAHDQHTDQPVAIKEMQMDHVHEWQAVELFEREARALKTISHPAIPKFIDAFHTTADANNGMRSFIVQQYIEGQNLKILMENGLLINETAARAFLKEMLTVLDHLHNLNDPIIHRDIKPSNIIRRTDQHLALIDFGAVQILETDQTLSPNHRPTIVGTSGYMPLEQMMGNAVPATDLYALAATTVHLLSQRHPADLPLVGMTLQFQEFVNVSESLTQILEKMLLPYAENRFASAKEVLQALQQSPSQTPPKTTLPKPAPHAIQFSKPQAPLPIQFNKPQAQLPKSEPYTDVFFEDWDPLAPANEPPPLVKTTLQRPDTLRTKFNDTNDKLTLQFPRKMAADNIAIPIFQLLLFGLGYYGIQDLIAQTSTLNFFEKLLTLLMSGIFFFFSLRGAWRITREAFQKTTLEVDKKTLTIRKTWLFNTAMTSLPLESITEVGVANPNIFMNTLSNKDINPFVIQIRNSNELLFMGHRLSLTEQKFLAQEIHARVFPPQNTTN